MSVYLTVMALAASGGSSFCSCHNGSFFWVAQASCFLWQVLIFLTLFIAVTGCIIFQRNWVSVYKVSVLAGILHLSAPKLVFLVGLIGCEAGFYAMYVLSCWIALGLKLIKNQLPENRVSVLVGNLKRNWYFPVSAAVFFRLYATNASGYYAGILIAFVAAVIISSQFSSFWKYAGKSSIQLTFVSIFAAAVSMFLSVYV